MNEVALDRGVSRSDARLSTGVRHYKLALTRAKQRLWHDRQRLWNDEVREQGDWLAKFHWQVYATPSFRLEVSRVQARSAVQRWLRKLGSDVYAYVTYEEGKAGGRTHAHALIGGLVPRGARGKGIHHLALSLTRLRQAWRHGHEDVDGNVWAERYDPRRGAAWYVAKCPYDGELLGRPTRHRQRRRR